MRVRNEPRDDRGPTGAFGELLRLQTEFSSRLAEETARYLRNLQGALGPAAPGTLVLPEENTVASGSAAPGGTAVLSLELENLQRVHCLVSPRVTPLVTAEGVTWFPDTSTGASSLLIRPGAVGSVEVSLRVPNELPAGAYRGALLLVGFREPGVPVRVRILGSEPTAATEKEASPTPRPPDGGDEPTADSAGSPEAGS